MMSIIIESLSTIIMYIFIEIRVQKATVNQMNEDKTILALYKFFSTICVATTCILTAQFIKMPEQPFFLYNLFAEQNNPYIFLSFILLEWILKVYYICILIFLVSWLMILIAFLQKSLALL